MASCGQSAIPESMASLRGINPISARSSSGGKCKQRFPHAPGTQKPLLGKHLRPGNISEQRLGIESPPMRRKGYGFETLQVNVQVFSPLTHCALAVWPVLSVILGDRNVWPLLFICKLT